MKKLDKFGLCLEEYTNNKNNAQVYYNRAIGKSPEMEVSKALAKIVKKLLPNFRENSQGRTEGTFTNFDSLDDKIDDLYYYMQYIKFGFGRSTRDVSRFIQNRHLNKSEGLKFIKKYDGEYPQRNLQVVLDYLSLKQYDFDEVVDKHRNLEIWKPKGNNWELINKL